MSALTSTRKLVADGFAQPAEAARFLGISKAWMYVLIKSKAISHCRYGRHIVIPWHAVHEFAASHITRGRIA